MAHVDPELAELAALAAAHLRWEMELGARGLPDLSEEVARRPAVATPDPASTRADSPATASTPPAAAIANDATTTDTTGADATTTGALANDAATTDTTGADATTTGALANDAATTSADTTAHGAAPSGLARLEVLQREAATCTACKLHEGRTKSVFARGNPEGAIVAFVGEGPGYHEDQSGLPFVGKAGQLLDKMIAAMGLAPDEIYVCNVVKCRPPDNRTPTPDEAAACMPYLTGQLEVVAPRAIVALGRHAAESLGVGGSGWRGRWATISVGGRDVRVMPTYHPAYLLRSPEQKRPVWEDLQAVVTELGRELPSR